MDYLILIQHYLLYILFYSLHQKRLQLVIVYFELYQKKERLQNLKQITFQNLQYHNLLCRLSLQELVCAQFSEGQLSLLHFSPQGGCAQAEYLRDLCEGCTVHRKVRGSRVSEIVEVKIVDFGCLESPCPR